MRRARLCTASVVAVALAALSGALACSTFGAEQVARPPSAEGGVDTGAVGPGTPSCTLSYVDDPNAKPDDRCGPGGAAVDLTSDGTQCGACGHRCPDGVCIDGRCAVEQLPIPDEVIAAKVHGNHLYYVAKNRRVGHIAIDAIDAIGADGGTAERFTTTLQQGVVRRIDFDDTSVYVSTMLEQLRFARDKDLSTLLPLSNVAPRDGVVALGETSYFYASLGGIERYRKDAPLDNPQPTGLVGPVGTKAVTTVVANGENAFWLVQNGSSVEVWGNFPVGKLLTSVKSVAAVVADATHVYFADLEAQQIRRVAQVGGNSESVAREPGAKVGDILVDGNFVYWTADRGSLDGWVLVRVSKCGGLPLVLANGMNVLTQLSADATYVYVANVTAGGGQVVRIAK